MGVSVTLVDSQNLGNFDLAEYNVLVAPPGVGTIVTDHKGSLARWVEAGGTLIAIGSSAATLANPDLGLSANRLRRDVLEELDGYRWRSEMERQAYRVAINLDELYGKADPAGDEPSDAEPEDNGDLEKSSLSLTHI